MRLSLVLFVYFCVGCVGGHGTTAQPPPTAVPTKSELVDVGGLRLHLRCEGTGTPVVVFDSGLGADGSVWTNIQPAVAKVTRACAYDRAGLGSSDPPPHPHAQPQMARELRTLLEKAHERSPYVLVGHSMGAANVRWILQEHPEDVAGMVLIDAATSDSFRHNLAQVSEHEAADFWANVRRLEGLEQASLMAGYDDLLTTGRPLDNRPLVILTAGKPESDVLTREKWQGELAALSANSVHFTVDGSAHNIHLEQPAWVERATLAVVQAVRSKKRLIATQVSGVDAPHP